MAPTSSRYPNFSPGTTHMVYMMARMSARPACAYVDELCRRDRSTWADYEEILRTLPLRGEPVPLI